MAVSFAKMQKIGEILRGVLEKILENAKFFHNQALSVFLHFMYLRVQNQKNKILVLEL